MTKPSAIIAKRSALNPNSLKGGAGGMFGIIEGLQKAILINFADGERSNH